MKAIEYLDTARELVGGDRAVAYGDAKRLYDRLAAMWSAYLETPVTAEQVCWMIMQMKMIRTESGHRPDNYVDAAGYAALAGEVSCQPQS